MEVCGVELVGATTVTLGVPFDRCEPVPEAPAPAGAPPEPAGALLLAEPLAPPVALGCGTPPSPEVSPSEVVTGLAAAALGAAPPLAEASIPAGSLAPAESLAAAEARTPAEALAIDDADALTSPWRAAIRGVRYDAPAVGCSAAKYRRDGAIELLAMSLAGAGLVDVEPLPPPMMRTGALNMLAHVRTSSTPVAARPCWRWKFTTAPRVSGP